MKKLTIILVFAFISLNIFILSCSEPTSENDNKVTFSGTVTLEGKTDHSGVTVRLYELVELDTTIVQINQEYPGVGLDINQRSEFFWREQEYVYQTVTDQGGTWTINNVSKGIYNMVVETDSFGWRTNFNVNENDNFNITLKRKIQLSGHYTENLIIPENSFVYIKGDVSFAENVNVTINAGSIIELGSNSKLEINGKFLCNGIEGNEINIHPDDLENNSEIVVSEGDNSIIKHTNISYIRKGMYFAASNLITIKNSRFRKNDLGFEIFDCEEMIIEQNLLSDMKIGYFSQYSNTITTKNIFVNLTEYGIKSQDEKKSIMIYNIIKVCGIYGMFVNPQGGFYNGGVLFEIENCDYISNNTHIYLGDIGTIYSKNCNFLREHDLLIGTRSMKEYQSDSSYFESNYWEYTTDWEIEDHILHRPDFQVIGGYGHYIDYSNFSTSYINWKDNI